MKNFRHLNKLLLLLLLLGCTSVVSGQIVKVDISYIPLPGTSTKDTLYYAPQRKLTWSDFKGEVRKNSPSGAITFTGFSYDAFVKEGRDTVRIEVFLQTYFDKKGSWVRPQAKNEQTLAHEQLHFDIAKLATEEFKDTLLKAHFSVENNESEIYALFWDYWRKMSRLQERYDDETRHGKNRGAQKIWYEKIKRRLRAFTE